MRFNTQDMANRALNALQDIDSSVAAYIKPAMSDFNKIGIFKSQVVGSSNVSIKVNKALDSNAQIVPRGESPSFGHYDDSESTVLKTQKLECVFVCGKDFFIDNVITFGTDDVENAIGQHKSNIINRFSTDVDKFVASLGIQALKGKISFGKTKELYSYHKLFSPGKQEPAAVTEWKPLKNNEKSIADTLAEAQMEIQKNLNGRASVVRWVALAGLNFYKVLHKTKELNSFFFNQYPDMYKEGTPSVRVYGFDVYPILTAENVHASISEGEAGTRMMEDKDLILIPILNVDSYIGFFSPPDNWDSQSVASNDSLIYAHSYVEPNGKRLITSMQFNYLPVNLFPECVKTLHVSTSTA